MSIYQVCTVTYNYTELSIMQKILKILLMTLKDHKKKKKKPCHLNLRFPSFKNQNMRVIMEKVY